MGELSAHPGQGEFEAIGTPPRRPAGRYVLALGLIAGLAVVSMLVTSAALSRQEKASEAVSLAAGQPLLAERLLEAAGELVIADGSVPRMAAEDRLAEAMGDFEDARLMSLEMSAVQSDGLLAMFGTVDIHVEEVLASAGTIRLLDDQADSEAMLDVLAEHVSLFEAGMTTLVSALQGEVEARIDSVNSVQSLLAVATLLLLLIEALFLFRPAARKALETWERQTAAYLDALATEQFRVSELAKRDSLTGLLNRTLFQDRLQNAVTRARREGGIVSLMFLDLDHFKTVNDRYGHQTGDDLLRQVAQRLVASVRESDTVARLGGDEFTVILEGAQRVEDAGAVASKILEALAAPYQLSDRELRTTASVGIAIYPLDGGTAEELLREADVAMYSAKDAGRNTYQYFTSELRSKTTDRIDLIDALRAALEADDQLELAYVPMVDVAEGKLLGAEAMLRWHHPDLGLLDAAQFMPTAEESDLIVSLGEWVIDEVCSQLSRWRESGASPLRMSLDVSHRHFRHGDLFATITRAADAAGIDVGMLELDVKEGALADGTGSAARTLERLRNAGVTIAVDDFGSGRSSLRDMTRLSIDRIKLDRSIARDLSSSPEGARSVEAAAVANAVLRLGDALGIDVVAHSVDTQQARAVLEALGYRRLQGDAVAVSLTGDEVPSAAAMLADRLAASVAGQT